MKDSNNNGIPDWLENSRIFIVTFLPPLVFIIGLAFVAIGLFSNNQELKTEGYIFSSVGGFSTNISKNKD